MKLNEVLRRLESMSKFSKPHICWPSGELMKTDEGKTVLSELYRVTGVVPINARHVAYAEAKWLQAQADKWGLKTSLIYDPYKPLPVNGDPDPAGEHGDLIRDEVEEFVSNMLDLSEYVGITAGYMAFDQERFIVSDDEEHDRHMTDRLNDFYRLSKVFQPTAEIFFYADGPIPNWNMEWSKWVTNDTRRDGMAPRCYTPQHPETIIKQLDAIYSADSIYPYLSLGSGYTVDPHAWKSDLHYDPECDRINARVMRDDDRVKAVNLYPQPGEPATHRYWEAFFAYAEGWA